MMGVEQEKFFGLITDTLATYMKTPTPAQLGSWWASCRGFDFSDIERVLKAHQDDQEDGDSAPRPIDVKRRIQYGTRTGGGCSAPGCQYPGTMSAGGPFYCSWHFSNSSGPEAERFTEASRQVSYETAAGKRRARFLADSQRAPGVVNTAWDIAKRHGDRPWQGRRFSVSANGRASLEEEAA